MPQKTTYSRLEQAIYRKAVSWAGQLTRLAKAFAPNHVRKAISSKVIKQNKKGVIIRLISDKKIAPDARAQEFGSGIHARRGPKGKYLIKPKNKKALAFHWEVATQNPEQFTLLDDGRVVLPSVEHPGIEAANGGIGYMAPAVKELRKRGRQELTAELRRAILGDMRMAFQHAKK